MQAMILDCRPAFQHEKTEGNDTMDALTFQAEIQRIERLMYRVSRSYLGNDEDAADAVQDALT